MSHLFARSIYATDRAIIYTYAHKHVCDVRFLLLDTLYTLDAAIDWIITELRAVDDGRLWCDVIITGRASRVGTWLVGLNIYQFGPSSHCVLKVMVNLTLKKQRNVKSDSTSSIVGIAILTFCITFDEHVLLTNLIPIS